MNIQSEEKKYAIGIDIGGTKCAVILGGGRIPSSYQKDFIIERKCFSTKRQGGWEAVLKKIMGLLDDILDKRSIALDEITGIGISCGGPLDYKQGIILSPPNLVGWDEVQIVKLLQEKYHVPVRLQNDANACALAEWKFGAAKGKANVIFLTFGTGLGAGLILNGRLYHGTNDMAGEVGHIRLSSHGPVGYGKEGSLEGFCSGGGIAQIARTKILEKLQCGNRPEILKYTDDVENITAKQIAKAAAAGDTLALEIFGISGHYLGKGLAVLIDILNPEMIVIGSIYERCEKFLYSAVKETIMKEALQRSASVCEIVPSYLKSEIGDYGALSVAFLRE